MSDLECLETNVHSAFMSGAEERGGVCTVYEKQLGSDGMALYDSKLQRRPAAVSVLWM